jgi:hypothetical protein
MKISPKLISVELNRVGDEAIITYGKGDKGFVATESYEPSKHTGRFPTQLFTNIDEDMYKYVKIIKDEC